jgi:hypothetical protein
MEEVIDLDGGSRFGQRSVNFGTGIELLMNDKKRSNTGIKTQIDLAELDNLENELNDLSRDTGESRPMRGLFDYGGGEEATEINIDDEIHSIPPSPRGASNLGHATFETSGGNTKTWDGFSKMNLDAEDSHGGGGGGSRPPSGLSERDKKRKKRVMIKKICEWHEKGLIKNNPNFTMDTPYEEVEDEYESCQEDKRKKDSIKLYGWWFMSFVNTVEYANTAINPFDLNLDGWGEQVSDDIDSYEEIFAELHEKYKGGKIAPELSLLLRLGFSATVVNFTNKALSSATPGFNDVIRQSPELMNLFTKATVDTMSKQSPSMGFMNNMMNPEPQANTMFGRPPAPVETQGMRAPPPPTRPGQMNYTGNLGAQRPDLAASRGMPHPQQQQHQQHQQPPMFREQGMNLGAPEHANAPERTPLRPPQPPSQPPQRREMMGPGPTTMPAGGNGIEDILANLKTKAVNIQDMGDDSLVSISSLKDLQANTTLPKSTRRRARKSTADNTISLDI